MTKSGRGVLLIITDAVLQFEAELNKWYDREHLIDRVGTRGFLSVRRYLASEGERKYLAVYETENIAVFDGAPYKHKLAHQSDWSKSILKQFRNPHRAVARIAASQAFGVGGVASVAIIAAAPPDRRDALRRKVADMVIPRLLAQPDIVAVHLRRATQGCASQFLNTHVILKLSPPLVTGSAHVIDGGVGAE